MWDLNQRFLVHRSYVFISQPFQAHGQFAIRWLVTHRYFAICDPSFRDRVWRCDRATQALLFADVLMVGGGCLLCLELAAWRPDFGYADMAYSRYQSGGQ